MTNDIVDRHVQGADEEHVPLDRDGYLDLDGSSGVTLSSDLADTQGSFVLLASGGAGKSFVLDDLRRREDGFEVDLVTLGKGEIVRVIGEAVASGKPVYMDSLDEALASEPTLFRVLARAMSKPDVGGVRWRLACRPSAWTSAFAGGVGDIRRLRLLPMTRDAARCLLAFLDVDEEFLRAVSASGQNRLTGSLLHFEAAARQWKQEGRLPGRRADALELEIQRLLVEREDVRQPLRTAAEVRRWTAGRLAAFSAFGGVSRFAFRTSVNQSTLAIADLPSQPEPDRPDITVGREVYEEVMGSPLFDTAPDDTVSFRHQEYVDYLAAKYVVDRAPVRAQVKALLGMTENVVPRAMASIAGWTVALQPDLADMVALANAVALVESEVELPPAARSSVVAALLTDAKAADARPMWSLDLSVVVHPELESQLADRVAAGVEEAAEVWWICRLALAGQIASIAAAALTMALDGRWLSWARRPAIAVVTELGTDTERSALLSGLVIEEDADPDDELRAGMLDGLYPRYMTTTELLPFIIEPRRRMFLGAYRKFLMGLADRVPYADLPEFLSWARENRQRHRPFESRQWLDDVSVGAVTRAFASSDHAAVLEPLADLVVALPRPARGDIPWTQDTTRRRRLAVAVATRLDDHQWPALWRSGLVITEDIPWLIDVIREDRATGNSVLAKCLKHLAAQYTEALTRLSTDDDGEEEDREEPDGGPDRAALQAATAAARHDLTTWCDIPLALTSANFLEPLFSCDLAERPGWSLLEADEQQEILDQGLQYVMQYSPTPSMWLGKTSVGLEIVRDWSGVYLMTTLARHAPTRLSAIPTVAWQRWAPAIANAFTHDHQYLVKNLMELAPAEAKAEVLAAVKVKLEAKGEWRRTSLHEFFAKELAPDLNICLQQRRFSDDQCADLLAFLIEHSPNLATDICRAVATDDGSALSRAANRHLGDVDANGIIDRLLREPVSLDVFLQRIEGIALDKVDDDRLAAFAGVLFDRLPFAHDPAWTDGWSESPPHDGARLRNHAVAVLANRGLVRSLRLLTYGRQPAERMYIHHHLRQARQVAADNAQVRLTPTNLLALLGRSDIRLIRNSTDLIDVIVDHFDEIQHDLTRNGSFRDLWSPDGTRLGSEDDITDWVRRRLTDRLGKDRLILGRESQVERLKVKGLGTRIDLTTSASTLTAPVGTASVIIEAKLVSNAELLTALRDQLVRRYLAATGQQYGIYLVYWMPPEQRAPGTRKVYPDKKDLLEELRGLSAEVAPQYDVRAYVLDVSWPSPSR